MTLCFATNNRNKIREIAALVGDEFIIKTMKEAGIKEDIEETGTSLEENSSLKARYVFDRTGLPVIADDSGLEVRALGGEPGVHSARYAGAQRSDRDNIGKLLVELEGEMDRDARFRTVITFLDDMGESQFEGIVEGRIIEMERGSGGFGYDPVFIPAGYDRTFAEMPLNQKNQMSHRSRAFQKLVGFLKNER